MDRVKQRHAKLLTEINDEIDTESAEYQNLETMMLSLQNVGRGTLKANNTLLKKLQYISTRGHLSPGNYGILRGLMKDSNLSDVVKIIDVADADIRKIQGEQQEGTVTRDGHMPHQSSDTNSVASASGQSSAPKSVGVKRKHDEVAMDMDDFVTEDGRLYYNTRRRKGYLLILEARSNRNASYYDVDGLKRFFRDTLHFEVNDPRSQMMEDLTLSEMRGCLAAARRRLGDALGNEYYCFICIILSHGNENGLATRDGEYLTVEEIRKEFTNDKIPSFTGKPKVFLIQACRGEEKQQGETVDEADDDNAKTAELDQDESDELIKVPRDADTLIAYSTTPGYKSFRRTGPKSDLKGSWFIQHCLREFEKSYSLAHLEEMLITVRDEVSKMGKSDGSVQMPCVWTTLRARLCLTPSDQ